MKKFIGILLIFLVLFNSVGFFLLYEIQYKALKKEVREILVGKGRHTQLTKIVIRNDQRNELCWHKENKEFSYKGQMYDIVNQEKYDDLTVYYCYHDKKETHLKRKLNNYIKGLVNDESSKPFESNHLFKKIFNERYLFSEYETAPILAWIHVFFMNLSFLNYNVYVQVPSPPPKGL